ncbi:MAG: 1-acyl-sn-glycerol-3-phosphate acyltransferase [Clostridia bacterium]|nr:1-acyl-sn-glycerol-3-phosphate acyltransferase [Clostridia bacterium]
MKDIVRLIVRLIFCILYRVEIKGRENIPLKGGAVLCANHAGELDMFFIGYRIKRLIRWMAKEELFRNPVVGFLIRRLGAFPVKRGTGDVGAIKTAFKLLDDNHILGMFIEGTRTKRNTGRVAKPNPGAAMFAIKKHVPVIPVSVEGDYKPFSKIKIVFGKPYYLDADKNIKYSNDELKEFSKSIIERVYAQMEEK